MSGFFFQVYQIVSLQCCRNLDDTKLSHQNKTARQTVSTWQMNVVCALIQKHLSPAPETRTNTDDKLETPEQLRPDVNFFFFLLHSKTKSTEREHHSNENEMRLKDMFHFGRGQYDEEAEHNGTEYHALKGGGVLLGASL